MVPVELGNEDSIVNESFSEPETGAAGALLDANTSQETTARIAPNNTSRGILDYPHYTRPPSFRGWD
ncbi:MAG: hypothetical protein ACRD4M_07290, partial [Candidatus Acidiferrales bacterium]